MTLGKSKPKYRPTWQSLTIWILLVLNNFIKNRFKFDFRLVVFFSVVVFLFSYARQQSIERVIDWFNYVVFFFALWLQRKRSLRPSRNLIPLQRHDVAYWCWKCRQTQTRQPTIPLQNRDVSFIRRHIQPVCVLSLSPVDPSAAAASTLRHPTPRPERVSPPPAPYTPGARGHLGSARVPSHVADVVVVIAKSKPITGCLFELGHISLH